MMSGELGMALGNRSEQRRLTVGEKHDGNARFLGGGPEPVRGPVGEPAGLLACDVEPYADDAGLLFPTRKASRGLRIVQRNTAHDCEAPGIAPYCLLRIVEPGPFKRRRDDDDAIHARFVHHRHQALDGERFGQLRRGARHPGAIGRVRFPEVDLRIDDQPPARGLRRGRWAAACCAPALPAPSRHQAWC